MEGIAATVGQGKVLYRGGEELRVEKATDRFTIALQSAEALAQLSAKLKAEVLRNLPLLGLVELQVAPEQLDEAMQLGRALPGICFASHVYRLDGSPETPIYLTNQITVQFAEATDAETMRSIAQALGLQVIKLVPGVPKAFVFEVTQQAIANPLKLAHQLMGYTEVLLAEPNVAVAIQYNPALLPGETDAPQCSELEQVQATGVRGDRSIVIALAEETIHWQHPGFRGMGIVAPVEFVGGRQRIAGEIPMEVGEAVGSLHSTRDVLLSTLIDIAPDCALMPIALGQWLDDQLVEQFCQWAIEQGAAVLVCGWEPDADYFPLSLRQQVALSRVTTHGRNGKGCVVVFAAGDTDRPAAGRTELEMDPDATRWLNGFAVHPDVITVAACTQRSRAIRSNWGIGISVCAQSERTGSASAIVAGTAALMLSVNPDLTVRDVRQMLQDTADRIVGSEFSPESQTGRYDAGGHSQWFGYGKVNALQAVQAAWQSIKPVEIPDRWLEQQNASPLQIPDGDPQGTYSAINFEEGGRVKSIEINLEIEHSSIGDLEIYLIAPKGAAILLQNRTLGRITLLRKTYSFETTPLLKTLLNHSIEGEWHLQIIDRVVLNTGLLKQWRLKIGVGTA